MFGPDLGVPVLLVKDWSADAIVGVEAARSVHLRHPPTATHPVEQAERPLFAIKEMLEREPPASTRAVGTAASCSFPSRSPRCSRA